MYFFFLVILLCYFFPYSGDDWAWGTQIGIDRLSTWFDNYNGRYAGNLLILILSRSKIIRIIVETLVFVLIVRYIYKITNTKNKHGIKKMCPMDKIDSSMLQYLDRRKQCA